MSHHIFKKATTYNEHLDYDENHIMVIVMMITRIQLTMMSRMKIVCEVIVLLVSDHGFNQRSDFSNDVVDG